LNGERLWLDGSRSQSTGDAVRTGDGGEFDSAAATAPETLSPSGVPGASLPSGVSLHAWASKATSCAHEMLSALALPVTRTT